MYEIYSEWYDTKGIISLLQSQTFPKNWHLLPLIRTCACANQGVRYIKFSENFAYVLNEWSHTKFATAARNFENL